MSLKFCAFTPHPPIIIPEVGKENLAHAQQTVLAMKKIAEKFESAEIDTVAIVSPHADSLSHVMTIFAPKEFSGDFGNFAAPEVRQTYDSNESLALKIASECQRREVPVEVVTEKIPLDHGAMVPLYYLAGDTGRRIKIIEVAFSGLPRAQHLEFGRIISKIADKTDERIALVGSGDLSHRIFDQRYSDSGTKFDQEIVSLVKKQMLSEIINIDEDLVNLAGECGYRSLLIMAGALSEKSYKLKVLSYEAPFGVGYLVANLEL